MVKVKRGDCEIYLDGNLKKGLDRHNERVEKDWDMVALGIGEEGDGKTTLIQQLCLYQDENFNIDNCVFSIDQFNERVDQCEPKSAILFDESDELDATNVRRTILAIKRKLKRIRSKNLKIWLVTPTFFDLNKYFVMHRLQFMIRVYCNRENLQRGFFMGYSRSDLRRLYILGKKEWDITRVKGKMRGRFCKMPKGFPIDQEEYNNKKDKATIDVSNIPMKRDTRATYRRECMRRLRTILADKHNIKLTHKEYGIIFAASAGNIGLDFEGGRSLQNTLYNKV